MYINSNNISIQNQFTIGGVIYNLIYMSKLLNFINIRQILLLYSNNLLEKQNNNGVVEL